MKKVALLLIDVQKGFDDPIWGERNNPNAENNIKALLSEWRKKGYPIIHIKHCSLEINSPLHPNENGNDFKDEAKPQNGEKQFTKTVNSAFIGTDLEKYLRNQNIEVLVFVGFTTDHCVSTSVRMAANLGFRATLISDATVTFNRIGIDNIHYTADEIQKIHLTSLNGEFCDIKTTTQIIDNNSHLCQTIIDG